MNNDKFFFTSKMTPPDSHYPSYDYVYVDFSAYSDFFDIKELVSFTSDCYYKKGEITKTPSGGQRIAKCDL